MVTVDSPGYVIYADSALSQATDYSSDNPYFGKHRNRLEHTVRWGKPYIGKGAVLDIGASPFFLLHEALRSGSSEAYGLFFSEDAHPLAHRDKIYTRFGDISLLHQNALTEKLPLGDGAIDTALCFETLEHFAEFPFLLLSELNRVIKMGGHLLLSVPNANSLLNLYNLVSGKNVFHPYRAGASGRHAHEYTLRQLHDLIECAGFEVVQCARVQIPVEKERGLFKVVAGSLMQLPFFSLYRSNIFGIGRKVRDVTRIVPPKSMYTDSLSIEVDKGSE